MKYFEMFLCLILFLSGFCYSESFKQDFEKTDPLKGWETEGDAVLSGVQFHSGKKSLFTPNSSNAIWTVSKDNKFGTVTFWVYDSKTGGIEAGKKLLGPYFGVTSAETDPFELTIYQDTVGKHGWGNYYFYFNKQGGHWSPGNDFANKNITKGWHKIIINNPDAKTLEVSIDDKNMCAIDLTKGEFPGGFNGVIFGSDKDGQETFFFDDIEINQK